jgi:hypothetical protein
MRLDHTFRLAFECPLRWEKLLGDDRQRYCAACDKHVTNLSSMSRAEAEAFLGENKAPICVRVEVDERDEPVFRPALAGFVVAGALVAAAGLRQATGYEPLTVATASATEAPCALPSAIFSEETAPVREIMGDVATEPNRVMMGEPAVVLE